MTLLLLACSGAPDREAGDRTPLTAPCSDLDPEHCLLPWPSSQFTQVDASTETGLRLAIDAESMPGDDNPTFLNLADGYSRVTGVAFGFDQTLDADIGTWDVDAQLEPDGVLQVFNAEPGSDQYGQRQAYFIELIDAGGLGVERTLLIGRPEWVLEPAADHVAIVTDGVGAAATDEVRIALGLDKARTGKQKDLAAYHAPVRDFLVEQGVDLESVVRVTDFTTRSATDPTYRTHAMMDELDASMGELSVEIDSVVEPSNPDQEAIIRGRLTGAPGFLNEDGRLELDADGTPMVVGEADIEFRISVPAGPEDVPYKVTLYGHGTGGDVTDDLFDQELATQDVAKLNLRFDGWTDDDFVQTLVGFEAFVDGSERSTAGLMQSIAGGTVLLTALDGVLGEALHEETGRWPDTEYVVWTGGSLGGTLGAVIVSADDRLDTAVLNVPGTGWSHMIPHSLLYDVALKDLFEVRYGNPLDMHLAMVMGQGAWDDVDGAVWADEALEAGGAFLLQESMGDPVLPNLGTNLLANALKAKQLLPLLEPIYGMEQVDGVITDGAALEQYRVPDTGVYDVHGFAARDTVAAEAAQEQLLAFLENAWEGERPMMHPQLCIDEGLNETCDFTEADQEWE
ncbi:MAG: hypothetical protein GY913_05795 [Proteobacteria bacterium]|nr:hypothetical protein [Pseudomonadota bacterium]MCP4916417.1 hypothetical protein [Pseudomonadota bacterium]